MRNLVIFLMFSLLVTVVACDEEDNTRSYEEQLAIDIDKIEDYLSDSSLTAISTESGLHYIIEEQGTGNFPTLDSIVEISYRGRFLNGEEFENNSLSGFELDQFILGWREGIPFFREGGKGMLFVPSCLAYGVYDYLNIPGNSVLVFNIELLSVTGATD